MTNPLISIIVPIYNVEKYLPTCLDSILAQTYKNLEIILVNDGSTDNSGAICDEYAARNVYGGGASIVVVHQPNGGVSVARNTGLDHATGDYIGFVDPDDWIEPTMYEVMLSHIEKENCDGAFCSSYEDSIKGTRVREQFKYHICHQPNLTQLVIEEHIRAAIWRTLFKRKVWHDIRFTPTLRAGEDFEVFPRLVYQCKSAVFLPDCFYHWCMRTSSITHTKKRTLSSHVHNFRLFKARLHFCQTQFPFSLPYMYRRVTDRALNVLRYFIDEGKEDSPEAQELITFLNENRAQLYPYLRFPEKFHFITFFYCRPLFTLYTKFIFWNRARIAKRRYNKAQS